MGNSQGLELSPLERFQRAIPQAGTSAAPPLEDIHGQFQYLGFKGSVMVDLEGWRRRNPCPDCWNFKGWTPWIVACLDLSERCWCSQQGGEHPLLGQLGFSMELELFLHIIPTAVYEPLVPAPLQILGKLLPKPTSQMFWELVPPEIQPGVRSS